MRFTIVNFVYLFYTIVKGFYLSKLLSVTSTNMQLLNLTPFKHTDKEDMFPKIQYTLAVLSNKVLPFRPLLLPFKTGLQHSMFTFEGCHPEHIP